MARGNRSKTGREKKKGGGNGGYEKQINGWMGSLGVII